MSITVGGTNPAVTFPDGTIQNTAANTALGPSFSAYLNAGGQTIGAGTWSKVTCQTKEWDTATCYDNTTNYRFTPTTPGYYQVNAGAENNIGTSNMYIAIYKNGNKYRQGISATSIDTVNISSIVYLNGTTDYVESYVYIAAGANLVGLQTNATLTYFQAAMIRTQ